MKKRNCLYAILCTLALLLSACTAELPPETTAPIETKPPVETTAPVETTQPRETTAPTETTTPVETAPPIPEGAYPAGEYEVGKDIPTGEYVFIPYAKDQDAVIQLARKEQPFFYAEFFGQFFWDPQVGDMLTVTDCYFFTSEEYTVPANPDGTYGPGMYRIGIDIPAGEYQFIHKDTVKQGSWYLFPEINDYPVYSLIETPKHLFNGQVNKNLTTGSGALFLGKDSYAVPVSLADITECPIPSPPEVKQVCAVPESSTVDTLVTPYWEQAIRFKLSADATETIYTRIPEIYPFSEEAIACQQEIYDLYESVLFETFSCLPGDSYTLLDPATTYGQEGGWPNHIFRYDYTASYQGGVLSIVVGIQDRNSGQFSYYPFELTVPTGKVVQDDPRLNVSDAQIAKTLGDYYKEMYSDFDPNFDHYQQCLEKTVSQENIDACHLFVAEDGTVMVIGYIYTMAGPDYVQKIIPLSS